MNIAELKKRYQDLVTQVPKKEELEQLIEASMALAVAELARIVIDDSVEPGVRVNAAAVLASYGRLITQRAVVQAQLELERMKLSRRGTEILVREIPHDSSKSLAPAN
jgi:hypothetical protein